MANGKYEHIKDIVDGVNRESITQVLRAYERCHFIVKELQAFMEELEGDAMEFLESRSWESYRETHTGIYISIENVSKKSLDWEQLKVMMNPEQLKKIIKRESKKKVSIITKDKLNRLKKYGRSKK